MTARSGGSGARAGATSAELTRLRKQIEATDDALLSLLVRRAKLARQIGRAKARSGLPVLDPAREARVVRRAATRARTLGIAAEEVRSLFWAIIALCRAEQLPAEPDAGPAKAKSGRKSPSVRS